MSWERSSSSSLGGSNSSGGGGRRLEDEDEGGLLRRDRLLVVRREAECEGRPEERAADGAARNRARMAMEIFMIGCACDWLIERCWWLQRGGFTSPWLSNDVK